MTAEQDFVRPVTADEDIVSATENLFIDIARNSDVALQQAVTVINGRRRLIRAYEAALIPDRAEELAALKDCWGDRDIPRLKTLIFEYYQRRHALAPQIVELMNRSGTTQ